MSLASTMDQCGTSTFCCESGSQGGLTNLVSLPFMLVDMALRFVRSLWFHSASLIYLQYFFKFIFLMQSTHKSGDTVLTFHVFQVSMVSNSGLFQEATELTY